MATIHIKGLTTASPQEFLDALTDFGPRRSEIWINSQPGYFKIHSQSHTSAEVTEGSAIFGGVWERLVYDWSNPGLITLKTIDGNLWTNASSWQYTITTGSDGRTIIDYDITRKAKNIKGRIAMIVIGLLGKKVLTKDFQRTLRAVEQRYAAK